MLLPAVLALAGITLGSLYQKRFCPSFDLCSGAVIQKFIPTFVVAAVLALLAETQQIEWHGKFIFALTWLVVVLSVCAISLLNLLIRSGSAVHVTRLFYLTPPTTAFLAGGCAMSDCTRWHCWPWWLQLQVSGGRAGNTMSAMTTASQNVATRILGLDPGLRITGFGIIDMLGNHMRYIASGTIRTRDGALPGRLKTLLDGVQEVIHTYGPDHVAVEKVFVNVNPQSTLLLGQARGAVICGAVACELPVSEYTALQVKQAVVGHGKAHKTQVQHMVQQLLTLAGEPGPDAADALACAICHANGTQGALGQLGGRRRGGRMLNL